MAVFVLDRRKKPLMPCSEKRARLLLERGRAGASHGPVHDPAGGPVGRKLRVAACPAEAGSGQQDHGAGSRAGEGDGECFYGRNHMRTHKKPFQ